MTYSLWNYRFSFEGEDTVVGSGGGGGDEAETEDGEVGGELGVRAIEEDIFMEKGFGVEWGEDCREFLVGGWVWAFDFHFHFHFLGSVWLLRKL